MVPRLNKDVIQYNCVFIRASVSTPSVVLLWGETYKPLQEFINVPSFIKNCNPLHFVMHTQNTPSLSREGWDGCQFENTPLTPLPRGESTAVIQRAAII